MQRKDEIELMGEKYRKLLGWETKTTLYVHLRNPGGKLFLRDTWRERLDLNHMIWLWASCPLRYYDCILFRIYLDGLLCELYTIGLEYIIPTWWHKYYGEGAVHLVKYCLTYLSKVCDSLSYEYVWPDKTHNTHPFCHSSRTDSKTCLRGIQRQGSNKRY